MDDKLSKHERIRQHLLSGKTLTQRDAIERFHAYRLGAVVLRLRKDEGLPIRTEMVRIGDSVFARYSLDVPDADEFALTGE